MFNNRENVSDTLEIEADRCRLMLSKMSENWRRRSQVNKRNSNKLDNSEYLFQPDKSDFCLDLIPFSNDSYFLNAPLHIQKKILSCGWLAYNQKTIEIETKIVTPACNFIIYGDIPGLNDAVSQRTAGEVLVDEAFHTHLVVNNCILTREYRGLQNLKFTEFELITKMYQEQSKYSQYWQKVLIQAVTTIVSEVFISNYLNLLAHDVDIQPINRLLVNTHMQDELSHSGQFQSLAKCMYSKLNGEQRDFFTEMLPKPVGWFASQELEVWRSILNQIGFDNVDQLITQCESQYSSNFANIDYSGIVSLAEELGILDSDKGVESFNNQGLLTKRTSEKSK